MFVLECILALAKEFPSFVDIVVRHALSILLHGAPYETGGLTDDEARYATQTAVWSWMLEATGSGYQFYEPSMLRPSAGNQAVYDFYLSLMDYAQRGADVPDYSASYNPSPVALTPNGQGKLVGTATIELMENLDYYSIDQSKLPAGVTVTGNTYRDGDTITVTAPMSYLGQTLTLQDCILLHSTCSPANVLWYLPDIAAMQRMVVYSFEYQQTSSMGLTVTSKKSTGTLQIEKSVSDGSSPQGFQFRLERGLTEIGTYSTDAQGRITVPDLEAGQYTVREINIPDGYAVQGENPQEITVIENETTVIEFHNVKKEGKMANPEALVW